MCQALQGLLQDSRMEGEKAGEKKGKLELLMSMIQEGILTLKQAADKMNMTIPQFEEAVKNLAI